MAYFYGKAAGLKADISRHRKKESELEAKISELEKISGPTRMDLSHICTYKHILNQLRQSKAEVVSRIGKKN